MTALREIMLQAVAEKIGDKCTVWEGVGASDIEDVLSEAADLGLVMMTDQVQAPVFYGFMSTDGTQVDLCFSPSTPRRDGTYATAYYTAPPEDIALLRQALKALYAVERFCGHATFPACDVALAITTIRARLGEIK